MRNIHAKQVFFSFLVDSKHIIYGTADCLSFLVFHLVVDGVKPYYRIHFIQLARLPFLISGSTLSVIALIVSADMLLPTFSSNQLLISRVLAPRAYRPMIFSADPSASTVSLFFFWICNLLVYNYLNYNLH